MGQAISEFFRTYIPLKIEVTDIVEIIIISFMPVRSIKMGSEYEGVAAAERNYCNSCFHRTCSHI